MEFRTLIGVDSLQNLLGEPRLVLLDCRFDLMNPDAGRQAYLSAHLPGAFHADLNRDLSAPVGPDTGRHPLPKPDALARRLGEFGLGEDSQVVAYDEANGSFAARAWWLLRWLGHDAVAVLDGGFKAWLAHGGALESGAGAPLPPAQARPVIPQIAGAAAKSAAAMSASVLSTAEVEQELLKPQALLVDARAPERYAGLAEPIDSVAGHIPGAVNHPFSANLGTDGRFLPAAELRARWLERLGDREPRNLIAMCGSGVTACHNLLALEVAGLPGARLYAGSWSEWIRDPRRAVARGNLP